MPKTRQRVDYRQLTKDAEAAIVREQKVNYNFLCSVLKTNSKGTIVEVLDRLRRKGVVAQNARRHWEVLVAADGTKRQAPQGPRRRRRVKRPRAGSPAPQPSAPRAKPAEKVTLKDKLAKLDQIGAAAGKETAQILKAIMQDVRDAEDGRRLKAALE